MTLNKKYLISVEENYYDGKVYIIAPPESSDELSGYCMKVRDRFIHVGDKTLEIEGSVWNKQERKMYYMFEVKEKTPGKKSKRFRYTEEEAIILYGKDGTKNFEEQYIKRKEKISAGPGELIFAEFSTRRDGINTRETGWFFSPENDKWVYPFWYDPLEDVGKHNRTAKGFRVLEHYDIDDISVFRGEKREEIVALLTKIKSIKRKAYKYSEKDITKHLMDGIPYDLRKIYIGRSEFDSELTKNVTPRLSEYSEELVSYINSAIAEYNTRELKTLQGEIFKLLGVNIDIERIDSND